MVIALLAFTMRSVRISPEAVGRAAKRSLEGCRNATLSLSMGSAPMEVQGVQGENGIIFDLNMSGEMHMRRRK